jgi:hypothetical protein
MLTAAVHNITVGIAPHRGKREQAEYTMRIPVWLRNRAGLPADEVASILAVQHPELGIETENDLYRELERAQIARRDAIPWEIEERVNMTQPRENEAEDALREFARVLDTLDKKAVSALRNAWKVAYLTTGHKHLGRLMVSGDLDAVISKMAKKGKTDD